MPAPGAGALSATITPSTTRRWPVVADGQYEGSRIPPRVPTILDVPDDLGQTGDVLRVNFGPNHPSTHGVLRLIVDLHGEEVPSVVSVWPTADWHEREQYDLMGIVFAGHPNLRRLIMPHDWDGHPLRKDYPIGGEPVQFTDAE